MNKRLALTHRIDHNLSIPANHKTVCMYSMYVLYVRARRETGSHKSVCVVSHRTRQYSAQREKNLLFRTGLPSVDSGPENSSNTENSSYASWRTQFPRAEGLARQNYMRGGIVLRCRGSDRRLLLIDDITGGGGPPRRPRQYR